MFVRASNTALFVLGVQAVAHGTEFLTSKPTRKLLIVVTVDRRRRTPGGQEHLVFLVE
jgi:hypothetical protein